MEENKDIETNQVYELGFHMLSSFSEDELEFAVDALRNTITKYGGSFIAEGTPELIDLAYTMTINEGGKHTKYDKAYFGWLKFEMDAASASLLKKEDLEENKSLLRYILIKTLREDTRVQMRKETLQTLEEVKTTGTIEKKTVQEEEKVGKEISDVEIDKAVEELTKE